MHFHIDRDTGDAIVGWVVQDNPDQSSRLRILTPDGQYAELLADSMRPGLRTSGLHTTGKAGFRINDRIIPSLEKIRELEVRVVDNDVLIYRRLPDDRALHRKLFFLELQTLPQLRRESLFAQRFRLYYPAAHTYPIDVLKAIISNNFTDSIFINGRNSLCLYQSLLKSRGFTIVTLLRDPFDELIERLIFGSYMSKNPSSSLPAARLTGLEPLIEFGSKFDFNAPETLATAFQNISLREREVLFNPYTRLLACEPGQEPDESHLSIALENLSLMDLVGLASHYREFKSDLADLLGMDTMRDHEEARVSSLKEISDLLRNIAVVNDLLYLDNQLYSYADDAIGKALRPSGT